MNTKKLIRAGVLAGSLLGGSATVTAISITGTLDFRALGSLTTDQHKLDGARVTLDVALGSTVDDDDVGTRADSTLFDAGDESRDLTISGSLVDGAYAMAQHLQSSGLTNLTHVDRLSIGGSRFNLDTNGLTLTFAGILLDFDVNKFLGPDAIGEFSLPGAPGSGVDDISVLNAAPTNADVAVKKDGTVVGQYELTDIVVSEDDGGADTSGNGQGQQQDPSEGDNGTPAATQQRAAASQVPVAPPVALMLAGMAWGPVRRRR